MTLKLEDIAALDGPVVRSRALRVHTRAPFSPTRRHFLRGAAALGAGVGLASLGLFPTARRAHAGHGTNTIKSNCDNVDNTGNDDCGGCNTDRVICCCNSEGNHRADGCNYAHRPDDCPASPYDGWLWRYTGCCITGCGTCRKDQRWRCTDGFFRSNCNNNFVLSICRHREDSGTSCAPCPC